MTGKSFAHSQTASEARVEAVWPIRYKRLKPCSSGSNNTTDTCTPLHHSDQVCLLMKILISSDSIENHQIPSLVFLSIR